MSVIIIFTVLLAGGCGDDEDTGTNPDNPTVPMVTTSTISGITETTAECGGNIISDGGASITARGVCWSTNSTPTVADNKTTDGTGTGSFTSSISGLTAGTDYFVRAYATNSTGTGYGTVLSFTTSVPSNTVTDFDGNVYQTVTIGSQTWMAENLKVTHYRDGSPIPIVLGSNWEYQHSGAYCYYDNNAGHMDNYGLLYNCFALQSSQSIAPVGWHVPSRDEWQTLVTYLGGETVAGNKLRETGTSHWIAPNEYATNESGFTAFGGGYRRGTDGLGGSYLLMGSVGKFWSRTSDASLDAKAWCLGLSYGSSSAVLNSAYKKDGYSVRLIKD